MEDSDFDCWNREDNDSANDDLWGLMGGSRSCRFTLILKTRIMNLWHS